MKTIYQFINVPLGVLRDQRGGSIIAAVFLIVVIGFLGAIVVSLVSTQSFQSVGELKSTEALYIADGGIEYILKNRPPLDYSMLGATETLGNGTFTVDSPAYTAVAVPAGAGVTITVNSTSWFTTYPIAGGGNVGIVVAGPSEEIACTGMTGNTFTGCNKLAGGAVTGTPSWQASTPCTAGSYVQPTTPNNRQYKCTTPGTTGAIEPAWPTTLGATVSDGSAVWTCDEREIYPVTRLNGALTAGATTVTVDSTRGFLSQGIIKIESEFIHYTGTTATTFTGCTRGFKGTTPVSHASLLSVYQYVITSTGSVSTLLGGTAQRVVRVTVDQ